MAPSTQMSLWGGVDLQPRQRRKSSPPKRMKAEDYFCDRALVVWRALQAARLPAAGTPQSDAEDATYRAQSRDWGTRQAAVGKAARKVVAALPGLTVPDCDRIESALIGFITPENGNVNRKRRADVCDLMAQVRRELQGQMS